jgi:hypothetical protein
MALMLGSTGCMWESDFSEVRWIATPAGDEKVAYADGKLVAGYVVEGNGTVDNIRGGVYIRGEIHTENLTLVMEEIALLFEGTVEYAEGRGNGAVYWGVRSVWMNVNGSVSAWGSWTCGNVSHPVDVNLTFTSSVVLNFTPSLPALPTFVGETFTEVVCEYSFSVNGTGHTVIFGERRDTSCSAEGEYQFVMRVSRDGNRIVAPNYIIGTAYIPLRAVLFNLTFPRDLLRETLRPVEWRVNGRAVQVNLGMDPLYLGMDPDIRSADPGEVEKFLYDMEDYGSWRIPAGMQAVIWLMALAFSALSIREFITRARSSRR